MIRRIKQGMKIGMLAGAVVLAGVVAVSAIAVPVEVREGKVYAASFIKGPSQNLGDSLPACRARRFWLRSITPWGARTDKLGRVVGFASEAPVKRMTDLADEEAVRAISEADAATKGASTPMLLSALDTARQNRDSSVTAQDRLTALSIYWNATLTARLITQLSRQN